VRPYKPSACTFLAAFPLLALFTLSESAAAAVPDFTGTWVLDKPHSDSPARPRTENESKKGAGSGLAKQVVRGVNIFGIPVGSLPLPAKHEPEPLDVDALSGAEQLLSEVTQIRILQEPSAAEFDYGGPLTATYVYGAKSQDGDRTVRASWNHDVFEVVHEIEGGARVKETYLLDGAGDLVWTVRIEQKHAETRVIERVFMRAARG